MAQIKKTTKNKNIQIETVDFLGVGQNIIETSKPTTRNLRVSFKRKNGTEISFNLIKDEVTFIKNEIKRFEEQKLKYRKFKVKNDNFYCNDECIANASEDFEFKKCKKQCDKCVDAK